MLVLTYEQGHDSVCRTCCACSLLASLAAASSASNSHLALLVHIANTVTGPFSPLSGHSKVLYVRSDKQQQKQRAQLKWLTHWLAALYSAQELRKQAASGSHCVRICSIDRVTKSN
jgi:hypothetical protein